MLSHHSTSIYLVKKFFIGLEFISFKLLQKFTIISKRTETFATQGFHCQVFIVYFEIRVFGAHARKPRIVIDLA